MTPDRSKDRPGPPPTRDEADWELGGSAPRSEAERVMRRFRESWVLGMRPPDRGRVREWARAVLELLRAHHPRNERTQELVEEALLAVISYDAEHPYPWSNSETSYSSRAVVGLREAAQAISSAYAPHPLLTIRGFCEVMHQTDVPRDAFDVATGLTLG